ncbi:MAG: NAD(P)/FAD-dependent oxidoreductase [Albidovulum sp.]|nr:NAD(P)/FAD-dependent oxidoreductase [Albidovulum sp.]
MAKLGAKVEFDAVIVGSGHNGLACAAHLAKKGWSVGVFEQCERPGGAVKTLELTLPGYFHDWGAMNLSLFAGSRFMKDNGGDLAKHGLEFASADNCFATAFPDGRWLGIGTDLNATVAKIAEFSREDALVWYRLATEFPEEAEQYFSLLGGPLSTASVAALAAGSLRRKGLARTAEKVRFLASSSRKYLREKFESEYLRATLAAWGMHLDFAPDIAGGAIFPYLESMASQNFGMVIGKGGADTVIKALVGMIKERGGELRCGCRVERVLVRRSAASGIRLASGEEIKAKKAVICGTSPGSLVDELLEGGSEDDFFDGSMRRFSYAPGTMMIHLALNDLPEWKAGPDLRRFAYVHLAPSMDHMARVYAEATAGLLPEAPVLVVGQPTAVDASRAPESKHVLWVQVRMVPAEIQGDAAGTIRDRNWDRVKDAYADRVIDILDSYAPGIHRDILERCVVSPMDLARDNPNLVGGDQISGSHHLAQNFHFRPAFGYSDGSTPVNKLHLTGASVWPGAGLGAASGYMLARQLAGA